MTLTYLATSLPVPRWAGDTFDLPSKSNISNAVGINFAFTKTYLKEFLIGSLIIYRSTTFYLWSSNYWYLKFVELMASQKLIFSIFPVLKGLNVNVVLLSDRHFNCTISFSPIKTTFQSVFVNQFDPWNLLFVKIAYFYSFNSLTLALLIGGGVPGLRVGLRRMRCSMLHARGFVGGCSSYLGVYWTLGF